MAVARVSRSYSPSSLLWATVIMLGLILIVTSLIASQYYGKDVATSLTFFADDGHCAKGANEGIGVHCFGDYYFLLPFTSQTNPWTEYNGMRVNYFASGIVPHWLFGTIGASLGYPVVGLIGYLLLLAASLAAPAVWASRGKPVATRIMTIGAFGLVSVPALMAIDRGNSVALTAPVLLAFLVALRRGNDRMTVITIVLASLVKPQYALLVMVLIAARKWKQSFLAIAGIIVTNALAFLVWPRGFPGAIGQAVSNVLNYAVATPMSDRYPANVSLSKGLYLAESAVKWITQTPPGESWVDAHAGLLGAAVVALLFAAIFVMRDHLPPHISGILVAMCASLFPSVSWSYYLVFALPVAAILLRDPVGAPQRDRWLGVLDGENMSAAKRVASALVVLATAMALSRVLLPTSIPVPGSSRTDLLGTSAEIVPLLWIAAALAVVIAWRPPLRRLTHETRGT